MNAIAIDIDINHSCGCCADSPLQMWPYKQIDGVKVFSQPPCFKVGEPNQWGIGEIAWDNWEDELQEVNISETVIQKIKKHFKENPAIELDD